MAFQSGYISQLAGSHGSAELDAVNSGQNGTNLIKENCKLAGHHVIYSD